MKNILFLFGTRPEAIKMAPLIHAFSKDKNYTVKVGVTAQHREMLDQVIDFFEIKVNYDLNIMKPNQTLHELSANLILKITEEILLKENFDLVFVQGDTSTVLMGAISSFYQKIPVVHIEAGLRSADLYSPFPEEMNRVLTSRISKFHFCPTDNSSQNLNQEGINENVFVVGNTVIDALLLGLEKINLKKEKELEEKYKFIDFNKKVILVTCHRRENFGEPLENICSSILTIANQHQENVEIVFPVHLNPNVKKIVHQRLIASNIKLIAPLDYPDLIWMMNKSNIILTDSGGIQEEAPSLGKPVLVLREVTERMEGVIAGTAILVGSDKDKILNETNKLLNDASYYSKITASSNPYGDGSTSEKIKEILNSCFQH